MTERTPGPWGLDYDNFEDAWVVTPDGLGPCDIGEWVPVAVCNNGVSSEANARLIAAAPDLLDALIELKEWIENDCGAECPSDKARDAIAKAEGRS